MGQSHLSMRYARDSTHAHDHTFTLPLFSSLSE